MQTGTQTVAIISKPQKQELATVLPELLLWLRARGYKPVLDPVSGNYTQDAPIVPRQELPEQSPSLVIVLGGDGTLLAAARVFAQTGTPIMSVNLGSLGFLTEVPLGELYQTLEGWKSDSCHVEERFMLSSELRRAGTVVQSFQALNDVVLSKGAIARMGGFSIDVSGQRVASYRADGIIVSTPTGSTAYSLAAAGPILVPTVDAMVITPVCPHLLTIRPLVVPGNAEITIALDSAADPMFLTIDGQEAVPIQFGDEVVSRRSKHCVRLVRLGSTGFFDVLRSKLKWGER